MEKFLGEIMKGPAMKKIGLVVGLVLAGVSAVMEEWDKQKMEERVEMLEEKLGEGGQN